MRTAKTLIRDAQADMSLRWVHMPFRWFCHGAAHISFPAANLETKMKTRLYFIISGG